MKLTLLDSEIRKEMFDFGWGDFQNHIIAIFKISDDKLDSLEIGKSFGTLDTLDTALNIRMIQKYEIRNN